MLDISVLLMFCLGCETVEGDECIFPFNYGGITYRECTTVENDGVLRCATTTRSDGSANLWGNCAVGFSSCTIRDDVRVGTNELRRSWGTRMLRRDAAVS